MCTKLNLKPRWIMQHELKIDLNLLDTIPHAEEILEVSSSVS